MKTAVKVMLVTLAVAAAVAACSLRAGFNRGQQEDTPRAQAAKQIAVARSLLDGRQYEKAMDAFVEVAANSEVTSEAVAGAIEAMDGKTSGDRLPQRLDAAQALWKRLPTTANREPLRAKVQEYLLAAAVWETKRADVLLNDRRKFVQDMWDNGEGDVRSTIAGGRPLSEDEVQDAESHMKDLQVPYVLMDLYIKYEPVAAALQRFADDDKEYLAQEEVSDEGLEEMGNANTELADSIWPVGRRLDKLAPGWRTPH